ncbi:MAG TPA: sialate O-acetylesterase [Armatimonadota bacterium]|nr:sialate O-acetylesterase [Armatimonadota bacterium]
MKKRVTHLLFIFAAGMATGILVQRAMPLGLLARGRLHPPSRPPVALPAAAVGRLRLFLLAGQSNMSGYGELPRRCAPVPRAYLFGNDYHWRPLREPSDDPAAQVDAVSRDDFASYSPASDFAAGYLRPGEYLGVIPCARNGASLRAWQRNLSDTSLYGSLLKRARAASPAGPLRGLLVAQGEAEASTPDACRWGDLFTRFVTDLRRDLGEPQLPVVFAQIGNLDPARFPYAAEVRAQQAGVRLPHCRMVATRDLPLWDGLHFTPGASAALGRRFAAALRDLERSR